jgi:hypothetical protein
MGECGRINKIKNNQNFYFQSGTQQRVELTAGLIKDRISLNTRSFSRPIIDNNIQQSTTSSSIRYVTEKVHPPSNDFG